MLPFCGTITTSSISLEVLFTNHFSVKNLFSISFCATSRKALVTTLFMLSIEWFGLIWRIPSIIVLEILVQLSKIGFLTQLRCSRGFLFDIYASLHCRYVPNLAMIDLLCNHFAQAQCFLLFSWQHSLQFETLKLHRISYYLRLCWHLFFSILIFHSCF